MNIIITNSSLSGEPVIDEHHQYVTRAMNAWGIGKTVKESLRNCKMNAPRGVKRFVTQVVFKEGFAVDNVDGTVGWSPEHDATTCHFCTVGKGIMIRVQTDDGKDIR